MESTAFDLAIFDQGIYLISVGKTPISSLINFNILGDHAAFILYLLAIFYKIIPDVHWLFLIQAIALSIGIFPIYYLSIESGLSKNLAKTLVITYLLYPLIFNVNLFDFHPDVIAFAAILFALLAAYRNQLIGFTVAVIVILSCKAVFSLTVAAMGVWLLVFKKKRNYGIIALSLGTAWFLLTTQLIIPMFKGGE